ncbi:transcription antitermination factor NusB [Lachnospiraceae bacterium 62-35]
MTRRELREHCFKMLFRADFYKNEEMAGQLEEYFESLQEDEVDENGKIKILHVVDLKEKDREELRSRTEAMLSRIAEIDGKLEAAAKGWSLKRMGRVELAILRLAVYEMKYDESIPEKVAINEAVELAKKFAGKDSPSFINGVLAKLV